MPSSHCQVDLLSAFQAFRQREMSERRKNSRPTVVIAGSRETTATPGRGWGERTRLSRRVLAISIRQMAVLAKVGIPWTRALDILAEQAEDGRLRWMWAVVGDDVRQHGRTLSQAMARYPRAFPPVLRALVLQGESTGTLHLTLERAADLWERHYRLEQRLKAALTYPAFVLLVTLGCAVAGLLGLGPFLAEFLHEPLELTGPRLWAMEILVAVNTHFWGLLGVALVSGVALYRQRERLRARWGPWWDEQVLRCPQLGALVHELAMSRVARTLATGLGAGLSWLSALELAQEITRVRPVQASLRQIRQALQAGQPLELSLSQARDMPTRLLATALKVGESTGDVPRLTHWLADLLEGQAEYRLEQIIACIQSTVLLLVGGFVAGLAMLLLAPLGRWV